MLREIREQESNVSTLQVVNLKFLTIRGWAFFTESALDEFRKSSKIIYDEFVSHVAEMRGIDRQAVVDTEAKTFDAETALGLGLIDSIMTKEQFYNHINGKYGENVMSLVPKTNQEEDVVSTTTNDFLISTLTKEVSSLKLDVESKQEVISTLTAEKRNSIC